MPDGLVTLPARMRLCETCGQSPKAWPYPQCPRCLRTATKPADCVPLVAPTEDALRIKVATWHLNHPGWRLVLVGTQVKQAQPTQSTPLGLKLHVAQYVPVRI